MTRDGTFLIENGRITAIRLAGETLARHWLQNLWLEGRADEQLRRWLLAPLSAPPGNVRRHPVVQVAASD